MARRAKVLANQPSAGIGELVTVYLANGLTLSGRVKASGTNSLTLETENQLDQLVSKSGSFDKAKETFGSAQAALVWMQENCPALGARPVDLIGTPAGVEQVEDVLACIDHGMIY